MLEWRQRRMEGGPVPRSSASCVVWGLKLGTLSTTNCALVPFMNIHSGVFRPRLISREIDEETRTFYHKRSVSPLAFSGGCWQNSPSSLAKKEKGEKKKEKLPEKHGTIWSSKWMGKQGFSYCIFSGYYACLSKKRKRKKEWNRNTII